MAKKLRLWKCPKCLRCWTRKKDDCRNHTCYKCREELIPARTFPDYMKVHKIREKEKVQKTKIKKQQDVLFNVPRDRAGKVLKISVATRKAWQSVVKSKSIETLARRADKWFKNLIHDVREVENSHGGMVGVPNLVFAYTLGDPHQYGEYKRSLLQGCYGIEVAIVKGDYKHAFDTLLHEALHWIDDEANVVHKDGYHDHDVHWTKRLQRFTENMSRKPR